MDVHGDRNRVKAIAENITKWYLLLMIGIFPFYIQNDYLNIVFAKKTFFVMTSFAFVILGGGFSIISWWMENKERKKIFRVSVCDIFAALFLIGIIVSIFLSPVGNEAFWGRQGRQLGGMVLLLCILVYFIISRRYVGSQMLLWTFYLSNIVLWIIILLHFFEIDVLGMHRNLVASQKTYFMGTMGNININSEYVGSTVALMMGLYFYSHERFSRRMYWFAVVFGVDICYMVRSDSWILALSGAMLVIVIFAIRDKETLWKCWKLCLAFVFATALMKGTVWLYGIFEGGNSYTKDLHHQTILCVLLSEKVILAEIITLLLGWWIFYRNKTRWIEKYGLYFLASMVSCIVVVGFFYLYPIKDTFGHNRGYIWKRSVEEYLNYSVQKKIVGYGPNCFWQAMKEHFGKEMLLRYKAPFLDAHNEMLQFLMTTGVMGVVSYFGMQGSLFVAGMKYRIKEPILGIAAVGIAAYFLQALVNNPQVFTTPLFFVFLGIMEHKRREVIWKNNA